MAKIKHTKNEMKAQKEALSRFQRFLPMLQMKKQLLQAEIIRISAEITSRKQKEEARRRSLESWVSLLSEPAGIEEVVSLTAVELGESNIAGVTIPVLDNARVTVKDYDLFSTPTWFDDAVEAISALIRLRAEREVLEEQRRLIAEELRVTSQRVNLFEKVKIPECRENIRVIKIFLGDEQTAAVARGKLAKKRTENYEYKDEAA